MQKRKGTIYIENTFMNTIFKFIDNWGNKITFLLIFIIFFKTCSTNGRIDKVEKQIENTNLKIDSSMINLELQIQIEGLKTEKRMIQSTDRKMLDVNRQSEIDKELQELEK